MADREAELAALYDLDAGDFDDDLALYENLARRADGPLLELGAGTGRVAIPLARAGFEVWGIDASEAMLARACCKAGEEVAGRLHLAPGDMRDFELERGFALIFAAFGTFHQLITTDEQLACLRCVRSHLAPGGLFVCDLRPLQFESWERGASVPLYHDWTRVSPETGETVTKLRAVSADIATQVVRETAFYDCVASDGGLRRVVATLDQRFTTRYELEGLMERASLALEQVYGSYDLDPYDESSEHLIVVVRRP